MIYKKFVIILFIILLLFIPISFSDELIAEGGDTQSSLEVKLESGQTVNAAEYSSDALRGFFGKLKMDFVSAIWDGVIIQPNKVRLPGGSEIPTNTGKKIKIGTDGNQVTTFDDSSGTTLTNARGFNYNQPDLFSILSAQSITSSNTAATNVQNYAVNQGIITASSAETFTVKGTSAGCTNCKDITYSPDVFKVSSADKIDYYGSTSSNVNTYEGKKGTFTVKSAENITIGNNTFSNVENSVFSVIGNNLVYADVTSSKDNNTAILENPIQGSSDNIKIEYGSNASFEVTILPSQVDFTMSKGISLNMTKISFTSSQNNAKLKIDAPKTPEETPTYSISKGTLQYSEAEFSEYLISECDMSPAQIDFNEGFKQVILMPTTTLCAGCRYSHMDIDKEKSYSLLNTGSEKYTVGFHKDGLLAYSSFLTQLSGNSWGFVDFPKNIELNAIISYERLREFMPEIETQESYSTAQLEFMPVYKSFDYNNNAMLNLTGKEAYLTLNNMKISNSTGIIAEINSGFHKLIEKNTNGNISRFENFNRQPKSPPYITLYSSDFGKKTPFITITGGTLNRTCSQTQSISVFTPKTAQERSFISMLQSWAAVSYDNMLEKYGPEK